MKKIVNAHLIMNHIASVFPYVSFLLFSEYAIRVASEEEERADWRRCSIWRTLTAPIRIVLWLTIPDCKRYTRLYPLTFIMCICWIGSMTYMVTWMITVVGIKNKLYF